MMIWKNAFFGGLLLFVLTIPVAAYTNIVANPSFEIGQSEPDGWARWSQNGVTCDFAWEEIAHTGRRSISITNYRAAQPGVGEGCWGTRVSPPIEPGKMYTMSVWVKAENLTSGRVYLFVWEDEARKAHSSYSITTSTVGWQQLNLTVLLDNATTKIAFELRTHDLNPEAKIYFDDVAIFEVPANTLWLEKGDHVDGLPCRVPHELATAGFMTYHPPGSPQWGFISFWNPANFQGLLPGTYKYCIRYWGDPENSAKQNFYLSSTGDIVAEIPPFTDGKFHYLEGTINITAGESLLATVKKAGEGSQGTNPIDWIWIGPANIPIPEKERTILEAPQFTTAEYAGPGQFKLAWTEPESLSPIILYQVYRGTKPNFALAEGEVIANTQDCSYIGPLDQSAPHHYYKVIAWNEIYQSSPASGEVMLLSDNIEPNAPTNFVATTQAPGLVALTWEQPTPAADGDLPAKYRFYRLTSEQELETAVPIAEVAAEELLTSLWHDRGMASGEYKYAIQSVDDAGLVSEAVFSNLIEVQSDDYSPEAPLTLEAFVDSDPQGTPVPAGAVLLRWEQAPLSPKDQDPASFYVIYRSETGNPRTTGQMIARIEASGEDQVTFLDVKGAGGKTYYYAVTSLDKALNESVGTSPIVTATFREAPKPIVITPQDKIPVKQPVELAWQRVVPQADELAFYILELARDPEFEVEKKVYTVPGSLEEIQTYCPEGMSRGLWYWRVKAQYQSGVESSYSAAGSFTIFDLDSSREKIALYTSVSPRFFSARRGGSATIYCQSLDAVELSATVWRLNGDFVANLVKKLPLVPGEFYEFTWSGLDQAGRKVPNGLYLILIEAQTSTGNLRQVQKVQVYN